MIFRMWDCFCMRQTLNNIREEVNELTVQNAELKKENDRLVETEEKLRETEGRLQELAVLQGQSVDELTKQVREWREISEQIEENLRAKIIQNIMGAMFSSDQDNDFIIDKEEVEGMKLRLKHIEGVDFSEANFQKAITKAGHDPNSIDVDKGGYSISAVLEVMKNLLDDDVPEEDNIFKLDSKKAVMKKK